MFAALVFGVSFQPFFFASAISRSAAEARLCGREGDDFLFKQRFKSLFMEISFMFAFQFRSFYPRRAPDNEISRSRLG
jgi:hypothetical protein